MNVFLDNKKIYEIIDVKKEKYFTESIKWLSSLWSKNDKERIDLYERFYLTILEDKKYIVSSNGKMAFYWTGFELCDLLQEDLPYKIEIDNNSIKICTCFESGKRSTDFSSRIIPNKDNIKKRVLKYFETIPSFCGLNERLINYKYFSKIENGLKKSDKEQCFVSIFEKEFSPVLFESSTFQDKKALLMTCIY